MSRNAAECFEILLHLIAANPTDQTHLEASAQTTRPMRHSLVFGNAAQSCRHSLPIGFEVEQQQRAFRQQGVTAHGSQVIEQRQQHQCHIPTTANDAFQIPRQLRYAAQQCIE